MLFPSCACFRQEVVADSGSSRSCLSQMALPSSKSSQARPQPRLAIGEAPRHHRPPLRSPLRAPTRRSASEQSRRRAQRSRTPRARTPKRAAEPQRSQARGSLSPLSTYMQRKRKENKRKVKMEPGIEMIPDKAAEIPKEDTNEQDNTIAVPKCRPPSASLGKTPRGAWIRRLPSPEPPAAKHPDPGPAEEGGGAERSLAILQLRQDQLQQCAAAALAKQFKIPMPAAAAAAKVVDRALGEAVAADLQQWSP